jgi:hypothetical protein
LRFAAWCGNVNSCIEGYLGVFLQTDNSDCDVTKLLSQTVGNDYASVKNWQAELRTALNVSIIRRLEPVFNRVLSDAPQATLEEKQALSRWANAELRAMQLAIKCPKTGEPASLRAAPGNHPQIGRFQIELLEGQRAVTSSPQLPFIELTCRKPRTEGLAQYWANKVSKRTPASRDKS